jgi:subtilisin family serine protease
MDWLLINNVRLIDISLATATPNKILQQVIVTAQDKGALIFAAVGNFGADAGATYPAAEKGVFAITAVDAADNLYNQANTGSFVDFSAPGVDIWTAIPGGNGAYQSGTSFAAPHALAVAALFLNRNQSLSRAVLEQALLQTIKPLGGMDDRKFFGAGLLQGRC